MDESLKQEQAKGKNLVKKVLLWSLAGFIFIFLIFLAVGYYYRSTLVMYINENFDHDSGAANIGKIIEKTIPNDETRPQSRGVVPKKVQSVPLENGKYYYTYIGYFQDMKKETQDSVSETFKFCMKTEYDPYACMTFISPFVAVYWDKNVVDENPEDFPDIQVNSNKSNDKFYLATEGEKYLQYGDMVSVIWKSSLSPEEAIVDEYYVSDLLKEVPMYSVYISRNFAQ